jgi:molybdate transport system ATP-binding protein
MSILVSVRHRQGDFATDVAFQTASRVVALFGPSGSGKSTLLHVIAGLIRPRYARIEVDGQVLTDTARKIFVPPHRRRIGYVFQDGRLFPHLTVRQNLLYGRWFTPRAERFGTLEEITALLGIGHLLDRRPGTLSGGEKQRTAIGRALLASPRLLLMDEPLSSLDAERKAETLPYIERLRDTLAIPIVYVSHSFDEIERLTDQVVRLDRGRVIGLSGSLVPVNHASEVRA